MMITSCKTAKRLFFALTILLFLSLPGCKFFGRGSRDDQAKRVHSIEFLVNVKMENAPAPSELTVKVDAKACGAKRASKAIVWNPTTKALKNVVIWLEQGPVPLPQDRFEDAEIVSDHCEFEPRIVIIPPGGTVRFSSKDPVLHSIRAQTRVNTPTYRVQPPNLETVEMRFDDPEIIPLQNDIHPWMQAFVVVAAHGHYSVTNDAGQAKFTKVLPGTYKIHLWHEMFGQKILDEPLVVPAEGKDKKVTREADWNDAY